MELRETTEQDVTVIALDGRLDAPSVPEVEKRFSELVTSGKVRILLDLAGVEYVSSSGLRIVIMLLKALEDKGGRLALCRMSPFVTEVFDITHLAYRFDIYPTREDALAALGAA